MFSRTLSALSFPQYYCRKVWVGKMAVKRSKDDVPPADDEAALQEDVKALKALRVVREQRKQLQDGKRGSKKSGDSKFKSKKENKQKRRGSD